MTIRNTTALTTTAIAAALAGVLIAAPAAAQSGSTSQSATGQSATGQSATGQSATGQSATGQAAGQTGNQEMSETAQRCLEDLRQVDQRLAESGYGRVGPEGYGTYGGAYRERPAGTAAGDAAGTASMGGLTSPRQDMQTLLRAGYIMAITGHGEGCQTVVQTAQDMGDRYTRALEEGDRQEALRQWRNEYLGSAIGVAELDRPMRIDEIIGADVRNLQDERLGEIEDVVLGANGEIDYVLLERGGFLGLGTEEVAVRWQDLKVTPSPYRDTLILDVREDVLENAPTVDDETRLGLGQDEQHRRDIDGFWEQTFGEKRG
ncbi:MAG: PRC-barrel domain-containing protein [Tistlia sp.]|uniref:PRC-barrel domain-containing protein n=1 Tax=Tistlia sp. TaxID=3057121 RepID=UPI0034A4F9AC